MVDGCIGPINIIPDNNEVVLQNVNQTITVIDNNCCTNIDVVQPVTEVVQILTGPMGKFPTEGPYGFTGSFGISGSLDVTGSIYGDVISSPYFTGSFYGNGAGVFSGSFSGSVSSNLQDITNNGNVTTLPITASSYYGNGLQIVGDATVTGSLTVSGSNTFRNIGPAQFTGSTDISGSLSVNGVDYEFTSASFDQRILNNSSSIGILSGSYLNSSASFNTRILNNSSSIALLSGSYLASSASFSTRVTSLENFSSSLDVTFATDAELNVATASLSSSIAYLSGSYLASSSSFDTRILNNSSSISLLSGSFLNTSSSLSTRVTDLENFSSSLDATFATDAELNTATASLSSSIAYLSSSYLASSASFSASITSLTNATSSYVKNSQTSSMTVLSASYASTASYITTAQTASYALNAVSSSYAITSSYSLNAAALSSSYVVDSASFDSRINTIVSESLGQGVIAVDVATSASLRSSSYYNGISNDGVGATLTSTANGALGTIDGVTTLLNWRILVKNQVSQSQNGVYKLTQTGSLAAPFILTRATDSDQTSELSPQIAIPTNGVLNKNINFAQITEDPTIGVDNIVYQQLSGSNNYLSQQTTGTQAVNQIPIYTSTAKELTRGSSTFTYTVSTGQFRIRNVPYIFPSTQGANGTVLMNNGSGTLRWASNFTGSFSGSFTGSVAGTASWASNALTASYVTLAQTASYVLQAVSASYSTTSSYSGNALSSSYALTASYVENAQTASYVLQAISSSFASTASYVNTLNQDVLITGSLTVLQGATIYGSASFQYVTSSQLAVSASYISVNVFEPAQRFGGLYVYDSGSSTATASITWDSLKDRWVYTNASGAAYEGGMFLSGPRNTGSLGDEPSLTKWFVARSDGGDHLNDTQIYSSGSITQITGSLTVTNGITASIVGTASYASEALSSSYALNASTASYINPLVQHVEITGSLNVTGSQTYFTTDDFKIITNGNDLIQADYTGLYIKTPDGLNSTLTADINGVVIYDSASQGSADFSKRQLFKSDGTTVTLDWQNGIFTGSLQGTSSWAENAQTASYVTTSQTASYVLNAVSSSYAATSSYATSFTIDETFIKGVSITSSILGSNNLFTQPTNSFTSAHGKYTLYKGANARAGEFMTVWNGTTTTYTDYSTTDIGNSIDVVFSSSIVGGNIKIDAAAASSGWTIKMLTTFI